MFACLKRKHTYILTGINSYYTKSNFHPIVASRHNMRHHFFFPSPRQLQLKNDYITEIKEGKEPEESPEDRTVKILCLSPVSVNVEAVHTNRTEPLFDGDLFHGYTVFSGNALCEFLKNDRLPIRHDKEMQCFICKNGLLFQRRTPFFLFLLQKSLTFYLFSALFGFFKKAKKVVNFFEFGIDKRGI